MAERRDALARDGGSCGPESVSRQTQADGASTYIVSSGQTRAELRGLQRGEESIGKEEGWGAG